MVYTQIYNQPHLKDLSKIPYLGLNDVSERLIGVTASILVTNEHCFVSIKSNDKERMGKIVLQSAFVCNFSTKLSKFSRITIHFSGIEFAIPNTFKEDGVYEGMFYKNRSNLQFREVDKQKLDLEFEDCEFNSQYKIPWVFTNGISNLSIKNCTFEDNSMGIYVNDDQDNQSKTSINITLSKFKNVYYPIVVDNGGELTVRGCHFDLPNGSRGIKLQNCSQAVISSCFVYCSMVTNDKDCPKSCFLHILDKNTRCSISNNKIGDFNGVVCALDSGLYGNTENIKTIGGQINVFYINSKDEPWSLCEKSFLHTKRHCIVKSEDISAEDNDSFDVEEKEIPEINIKEEDYIKFCIAMEAINSYKKEHTNNR